MRIVLVSSGYLPQVGGLERVTHELASAWKEAGHEVRVITNRSVRSLAPYEKIDGIPVWRYFFVWEFPELRLVSIFKFLIHCLYLPYILWSLWDALDPRKTDLVNVHYVGAPAWWAVFVAKRRLLPVVVTLHGSDLLTEPKRSRLKRIMLRKVLGAADGVSTVSRFMLKRLEELIPELRGKGIVIWNGFNPSEFKTVQKVEAERPYGLCVSRLSHQKGHVLLLKAFEALGPDPGFDLVILGNGPMLKILDEESKQSPIHPHLSFRGSAPHLETLSLMKGASFVVIPSEAEPFGLVAAEARMLGQPIVAFERGALPEVLEHYRGVRWVKEGTPLALARGMQAAIKAGEIAPEVNPFFEPWEAVAGKYTALFAKHLRSQP